MMDNVAVSPVHVTVLRRRRRELMARRDRAEYWLRLLGTRRRVLDTGAWESVPVVDPPPVEGLDPDRWRRCFSADDPAGPEDLGLVEEALRVHHGRVCLMLDAATGDLVDHYRDNPQAALDLLPLPDAGSRTPA